MFYSFKCLNIYILFTYYAFYFGVENYCSLFLPSEDEWKVINMMEIFNLEGNFCPNSLTATLDIYIYTLESVYSLLFLFNDEQALWL